MNNIVKYTAAVDIGTSKTTAIIAGKDSEGNIEILGYETVKSEGVKRGVIVNIEESAQTIKQAIDSAIIKSGVSISAVFAGISGQHLKCTVNRGSKYIESADFEITQRDVDELYTDMLKLPVDDGEEIIHAIPQSYIIDNEPGVRRPVGITGKRLEADFNIVTCKIATSKNIKKCINRIGLNVIELILTPLATAEATLTEDEKEAGVVLVDIGGGTTDIAVYYDGILKHTAIIPFGGSVITRDIKEGCSILNRQAEQLKMQFGSALGDLSEDNKVVSIPGISGRKPKEISFKNLAFIIQSRMEEIIEAIIFEIGNSGVSEKIGAGIVLTGGGALLNNISELINLQTGFDVRIATAKDKFSKDSLKDLDNPGFSTALGLILRGFNHEDEYNIIKEEEVVEQEEEDEEPEQKQNGMLSSIRNKLIHLMDDKNLE